MLQLGTGHGQVVATPAVDLIHDFLLVWLITAAKKSTTRDIFFINFVSS
jgi:hypothetical protein